MKRALTTNKCSVLARMTTFRYPRPLVICGPSGSGKSTLLKLMLADYPHSFGFSISHTTRKPRMGEVDGKHYYFTTMEDMLDGINEGQFLETATFCGNMYGTSRAAVEAVRNNGKICVLDIDVQGVKQIKNTNLNPWFVFIKPPSLEVLKRRLEARNSETCESLDNRLRVASKEMKYGDVPGNFDYVIVNDNLDDAYLQLKQFLEENVLKNDD